jgi:hypothetical protein
MTRPRLFMRQLSGLVGMNMINTSLTPPALKWSVSWRADTALGRLVHEV